MTKYREGRFEVLPPVVVAVAGHLMYIPGRMGPFMATRQVDTVIRSLAIGKRLSALGTEGEWTEIT